MTERPEPNHEILFEPVRIGPKTLRNRFYQVPFTTGFTNNRPYSEARHRALKAEGGWAAVSIGACSISEDADEWPVALARLWDESDARALAIAAEEIHSHGALAAIELHHGGAHAERRESRAVGIAPSQLASDMHQVIPKAMTLEDIGRIQADWARAAAVARAIGYDIVYVYGAHSYLPMQFLSPYYNKRTDTYGGTFENRARFWLETLDLVRAAVGDDCAIVSRISVNALGPAGVERDEALRFIEAADPWVDMWDVNIGSISKWAYDSGASRFFDEGYQEEWTKGVRDVTAKPVCGVGRYTSPDLMARAVRDGILDVIGSARSSIADPFLPAKIASGRPDLVRECTGSNQCIARGRGSPYALAIVCSQNPTAGEEYRRDWHPERFEPAGNRHQNALVVGAGPAGLECATVLGRRGFDAVHLVEAAEDVGGHLRWVRRLPGMGGWGRIVDHRQVLLDELANVEVITGRELSSTDVVAYGADLVIVATGAKWSPAGLDPLTHEPIPGADASAEHCLTPEQIMVEGKAPPEGASVVVYDAEGYYCGVSLAEKLSREGHPVHYVTPLAIVAPYMEGTLEGTLMRTRLHELGVTMTTGTAVTGVDGGAAITRSAFGETGSVDSQAVVLITQRQSSDGLFLELTAGNRRTDLPVYRIGDCVAPRIVADVLFDGHRLGREIDSADPARPLPFRREAWLAADLVATPVSLGVS